MPGAQALPLAGVARLLPVRPRPWSGGFRCGRGGLHRLHHDATRLRPCPLLPGLACKKLRQWDKAFADFSKAIELDPKNAPAHNDLGIVLQAKNQLDEASAEYRKAIDVDPKYAMPHYNLGIVLQAKNQLDGASAEYRKAIELDPKHGTAHNNLGEVLRAKNQLDEASAEYRKAIELDPKHAAGPQQPRPGSAGQAPAGRGQRRIPQGH